MHSLDGDPVRYPLLSREYKIEKNGALALAFSFVIGGGEGYFRQGNVVDQTTALISKGIPFDSQQQTEVGRWDNRSSDIRSSCEVDDNMFYAWADPDYWDYEPCCAIYTKDKFMLLFADCCRNYVNAYPERREEFAEALLKNGMSL